MEYWGILQTSFGLTLNKIYSFQSIKNENIFPSLDVIIKIVSRVIVKLNGFIFIPASFVFYSFENTWVYEYYKLWYINF